MSYCDETEAGFGWISPNPGWMGRASHALAAGGRVWLVDPVDFPGLDERARSLGEPQAVLQLLGRHGRDCAAVAARLGVPHLLLPATLPGTPFQTVPVRAFPLWTETALWWEDRRTLIVSEALGTTRYYRAPGSALGVHPFLRVLGPPKELLAFAPEHILCGHGPGVHVDSDKALRDAVRRSRRELPAMVGRVLRARRSPAL